MECSICFEDKIKYNFCITCGKKICSDCCMNIDNECPFVIKNFRLRE